MMKETSVWKNSGKFFKKGIVMKELHIFNGDYALELWKNSNFDSENLVWRETYLEGPLPATDDLHQFRKARADFLPALAGLSPDNCISICKNWMIQFLIFRRMRF